MDDSPKVTQTLEALVFFPLGLGQFMYIGRSHCSGVQVLSVHSSPKQPFRFECQLYHFLIKTSCCNLLS